MRWAARCLPLVIVASCARFEERSVARPAGNELRPSVIVEERPVGEPREAGLPSIITELAGAMKPVKPVRDGRPCVESFRAGALYDRSTRRWLLGDVEWELGEGYRVRWLGFASPTEDLAIEA